MIIMEKMREDFEMIYMKVTGDLGEDISLPWVEDAFVNGTGFKQAYDAIWKARDGLCRRFGLDWEDQDLEGLMAGITDLERDLAQRMFYYGMVYARRNYKI